MTGRAHGFSVVEVMIATALVAVLMTLAFPSFRGVTIRAHRTEAISVLLQAASCQERLRAVVGLYDTGKCLPAQTDRYAYRFEPADAGATDVFQVFAEPRNAQAADRCGTMMLSHDGRRTASGAPEDGLRCWISR